MGQRLRVLNLTVCLIIANLWSVSAFHRAVFTAERPKLLVGHQVNLTCRVDCERIYYLLSSGYECNSSYMYIKSNRVMQNTTILNNLTVQFEAIADQTSGSHQTFMCYMGLPLSAIGTRGKYLAMTSIEIYKPMVPENLDCVTPNWEKAICKWCDEEVYGMSTWEVKYKEGISGNWSSCPDMPGEKGCTCIWSNENGRHDFNRNTMNVSISGTDALGTITTKTFGINFFDNSLNANECTDGQHQCTSTMYCVNTPSEYECKCLQGLVDRQTGTSKIAPKCEDVNECTTTCKKANSVCTNTVGSFICRCKDGYWSSTPVTTDCTDPCSPNPCENKGTCAFSAEIATGYKCTCEPGFTGTQCDVKVTAIEGGSEGDKSPESKLTLYAIIGGVAGVVVIIAVAVGIYCGLKKKNAKQFDYRVLTPVNSFSQSPDSRRTSAETTERRDHGNLRE